MKEFNSQVDTTGPGVRLGHHYCLTESSSHLRSSKCIHMVITNATGDSEAYLLLVSYFNERRSNIYSYCSLAQYGFKILA